MSRRPARAPRSRGTAAALAVLLAATGTRWTIALSQLPGDPTLAEQSLAADRGRRDAAAEHPLVRAILDAFPGAVISAVTDSRADAYGLVDEAPLGEPEGREFAPPDADAVETMEDGP